MSCPRGVSSTRCPKQQLRQPPPERNGCLLATQLPRPDTKIRQDIQEPFRTDMASPICPYMQNHFNLSEQLHAIATLPQSSTQLHPKPQPPRVRMRQNSSPEVRRLEEQLGVLHRFLTAAASCCQRSTAPAMGQTGEIYDWSEYVRMCWTLD